MKQYLTIGMAGHIDHGKTTLTKALTGVNTDRLKEEQERNISIELGFASLIAEPDLDVSLIDVPGHENFIRQMIAGVAGIDYVILVIAADEGVMPQTREHVAILSLLGIEHGCVVLTKKDETDTELCEVVLEDVRETLSKTFLADAPLFAVDSVSGTGIPVLQDALCTELRALRRTPTAIPFRLPIDHAFTVKGQGVIARGTVYNGHVSEGETLTLLPTQTPVRVRQIQTHGQQVEAAYEGQRTALNLGGVTLEQVARGDVLVQDDFFSISDRIDIVLTSLPGLAHPIKQRQLVKLHIGTTEVMGTLIFFDRNDIDPSASGTVPCQLQLERPIVVARGDRFIVRRPSPTETIGGGWVIDPHADTHRFGAETMAMLQVKQDGTPQEQMFALIDQDKLVTKQTLLQHVPVSPDVFAALQTELIAVKPDLFTRDTVLTAVQEAISARLGAFHDTTPLQRGLSKAALVSELEADYPRDLLAYALDRLQATEHVRSDGPLLALTAFQPTLPAQWAQKLAGVEAALIEQGAETETWTALISAHQIPEPIATDYYHFLLATKKAFVLGDERLISAEVTAKLAHQLAAATEREPFTLQSARATLGLSRKHLVPFLELLDERGYTERSGTERRWKQGAPD